MVLMSLLVLSGCRSMVDHLVNNLNGIEKTLKDIYAFIPDEDGYRYVTPHESDVVSVMVALDRYYDNFKLVLDINLTENRNLIIRDFNGKLRYFQIQKVGDYALEAYYYEPNIRKEHKRYGHTYHGVTLGDFKSSTGLKYKNIREIMDNYDMLYEYINNLPEIISEENQFIIHYDNNTFIIEVDADDEWIMKISKLFSLNEPSIISTVNTGGKFILYKRRWTEEDTKRNLSRIDGSYFAR